MNKQKLGCKLTLLAATLVFWQCGHQAELQTKDSAGQEIVLNEISDESLYSLIDSIDFIPLETTDESLIHFIAQLDIMDDYLYILNGDFASVLIYNRQGKPVNSIHNQGRGPKEYIRINGMYLDRLNHRIILSDTFSKRLLIYDRLGILTDVIPLEICQGHVVPFLQNRFIHINEGIEDMLPERMQNYNLTIMDENGQIEQSILPDQTPNPLYIDTRNNVQCLSNGEIAFSPLQSGEIYRIGADSIMLKYYFTSALKGYKMMTPADLKKISYKVEDTESSWDSFEKQGYLCFTGACLEDSTLLFTTLGLHAYRYFVFYNKHTGQSTIIDCTTPDRIDPQKMTDKDALKCIFASQPLHIEHSFVYIEFNQIHKSFLEGKTADKRMQRIYDALGEDDNPLIVRYRLRTDSHHK